MLREPRLSGCARTAPKQESLPETAAETAAERGLR